MRFVLIGFVLIGQFPNHVGCASSVRLVLGFMALGRSDTSPKRKDGRELEGLDQRNQRTSLGLGCSREQFSKQAAFGTQFPALFVKSDYRRAHVHIRQASGNAPIRNLRCGRCKTLIGSDAVQSLTPRTSLQDRRMLVCGAGEPPPSRQAT